MTYENIVLNFNWVLTIAIKPLTTTKALALADKRCVQVVLLKSSKIVKYLKPLYVPIL